MHTAPKWQQWHSNPEEVGFAAALRACESRDERDGDRPEDEWYPNDDWGVDLWNPRFEAALERGR
jgi:hypothetical protein